MTNAVLLPKPGFDFWIGIFSRRIALFFLLCIGFVATSYILWSQMNSTVLLCLFSPLFFIVLCFRLAGILLILIDALAGRISLIRTPCVSTIRIVSPIRVQNFSFRHGSVVELRLALHDGPFPTIFAKMSDGDSVLISLNRPAKELLPVLTFLKSDNPQLFV